MRIAVTAQGADRNSPLDSHFGRARFFLIADTDSNALDVRNNADLQQTRHLAGIQAAGTLISMGVQVVVTGNIGPKAFATLTSAGARVFKADAGTVAEVIELFKAGKLSALHQANVDEHWPQPTGS